MILWGIDIMTMLDRIADNKYRALPKAYIFQESKRLVTQIKPSCCEILQVTVLGQYRIVNSLF
jgi:hypothetical protein